MQEANGSPCGLCLPPPGVDIAEHARALAEAGSVWCPDHEQKGRLFALQCPTTVIGDRYDFYNAMRYYGHLKPGNGIGYFPDGKGPLAQTSSFMEFVGYVDGERAAIESRRKASES